jgi:hypothetical protein
MSYTDDVARPWSWCRTKRIVERGIHSHRFNGFDCHTWGAQLRRYPNRPKRPFWLMRLRRA